MWGSEGGDRRGGVDGGDTCLQMHPCFFGFLSFRGSQRVPAPAGLLQSAVPLGEKKTPPASGEKYPVSYE